jgi:hypothetical protein
MFKNSQWLTPVGSGSRIRGRIGHIYILRRRIGHIWVVRGGGEGEGEVKGKGT